MVLPMTGILSQSFIQKQNVKGQGSSSVLEACLANTRLLAQSLAVKRKKKKVFIKQSICEDMSGNVVGPEDNKDKKATAGTQSGG